MANLSKLFRAPAMFGRFTIVARILGRPMFFVQKMAGVKISEHFFRNKSCLSPVPKESDRLLNPFKPLTSSTAQGGGGSFKNRNPIGDACCCGARQHSGSRRFLSAVARTKLPRHREVDTSEGWVTFLHVFCTIITVGYTIAC